MEQKDKWRDTGKDVRKMITAQIVSFLMTAAGLLGGIGELMSWNEKISVELISDLLFLVATGVFLIFLLRRNLLLFRIANFLAAVAMGMIFALLADYCLFGEDLPPSSLLFLGIPSALCAIAGLLAGGKGITPASKAMIFLAAVIRGVPGAFDGSLLLAGIASWDFDWETLSSFFSLGTAVMYINMAVYMHKTCS